MTDTFTTTSRLRSVDGNQARFLSRWLTVWVVLLTVVVLVVVVYLIFITNSLSSINGNLGITTNALVPAGGHVATLPDQISKVNASLTSIDNSLKPLTYAPGSTTAGSGQTSQIAAAATSINTSLQAVDGSLKDTESLLANTSSSLVNTSGVLQTVLGTAGSINTVLNQANLPAGLCSGACSGAQVGVQNIWQRVDIANATLTSARGDTNNVAVSQVPAIDSNLLGICNGPVVTFVGSPLVHGLLGAPAHRGC